MTTRELPGQNPRVETGPTKFGDDWTGVFIRGDNAMNYAMQLHALLGLVGSGDSAPAPIEIFLAKRICEDLRDTLMESSENPAFTSAMFKQKGR